MANHFYSLASPGPTQRRQRSDWTVGTGTAGAGIVIEVNVKDATLTARQVYNALEQLADYFARRDSGIIAAGTLIG